MMQLINYIIDVSVTPIWHFADILITEIFKLIYLADPI